MKIVTFEMELRERCVQMAVRAAPDDPLEAAGRVYAFITGAADAGSGECAREMAREELGERVARLESLVGSDFEDRYREARIAAFDGHVIDADYPGVVENWAVLSRLGLDPAPPDHIGPWRPAAPGRGTHRSNPDDPASTNASAP